MLGWEKHIERKLAPFGREFSEMGCAQGKIFPTIINVYWFWHARKVACIHTEHTTARQLCRLKCPLCSYLPSLRSHYLLLSLLVRYTNHRPLWAEPHTANLDALLFSINKSPPSEVEPSEYFPQLISASDNSHLPFLLWEKKQKKHSMDTQWKNENYGFAQIHKTSKLGSQTHQLNMINHVNLGLFNVYFWKSEIFGSVCIHTHVETEQISRWKTVR